MISAPVTDGKEDVVVPDEAHMSLVVGSGTIGIAPVNQFDFSDVKQETINKSY